MSLLDRVLTEIAPGVARRRMQEKLALQAMTSRYDAAGRSNRTSSLRPIKGDADAASYQRQILADVARDMIRNSPFAARARAVISGNVIGDGIIPKPVGGTKAARKALLQVIRTHLDTTSVDFHGRANLYGLQRQVMETVVDSGEVLVRRIWRTRADGLPLPFQIEIMECDHLDKTRDGTLPSGGSIREGIQYDAEGKRSGYWIFPEHPGASGRWKRQESRFIPASDMLHIFRQDRPGQTRGASWFGAVAISLMDFSDNQDAELMRQKIAACFAGFRTQPDAELLTDADGGDRAKISSLVPGRIQNLAPGEGIVFSSPPASTGYDNLATWALRAAAAGLGITYEAVSGDLSRVNFSSARLGRMEMDRNVSAWQWLLIVPQFCQPFAAWMMESVALYRAGGQLRLNSNGLTLDWVPPARIIIDPAREIPAIVTKIEGRLSSLQSEIRGLGYDPETVFSEQEEDAKHARIYGLNVPGAGQAAAPPAALGAVGDMDPNQEDQNNDTGQ